MKKILDFIDSRAGMCEETSPEKSLSGDVEESTGGRDKRRTSRCPSVALRICKAPHMRKCVSTHVQEYPHSWYTYVYSAAIHGWSTNI